MVSAADAGGVGTRFGKYQLLKRLASGGMGEVFLAKQVGPVGFEKLLVIKRILAQHLDKESYVQMFFSEARLAALLNHSNIVQIFDMGEEQDHLFIAMEYVHGRALRDLIDAANRTGHAIPLPVIIEIGMQVCAGLSYAHNMTDPLGNALNIVHRDINPHNILVSYHGDVKVIDFGIAKSDINTHKTETGTIKGKYVYMSPEQSAAEPLDRRSDVFALGIVFYEMCTGVNPFHHANIVQSLEAIQRKEPPPVDAKRPDVSLIAPIIHKMLAKDAADRFSDCAEVRDALAAVQVSGRLNTTTRALPELMSTVFSGQMAQDRQVIIETSGWGLQAPPKRTATSSGERKATNVSRMAELDPPPPRAEPTVKAKVAVAPPPRTNTVPAPRPAGGTYRQRVASEDDPFPDAAPTELEDAPRVPATAAAASSKAGEGKGFPWVAVLVVLIALLAGGAGALYWRALHRASAPPPPVLVPVEPTAVPEEKPADTPVKTEEEPAAPAQREAPRREPRRQPEEREKERAREPAREPAQATPPPDEKKPAEEKKAPEEKKPEEAPRPVGRLRVKAPAGVEISMGRQSGQGTATFVLDAGGGVVKVGGGDAGFQVSVRYSASPGGVELEVDSEPWAIVQVGGVGLGRTPQRNVCQGKAGCQVVLKNPKVPTPMEIGLTFRPMNAR